MITRTVLWRPLVALAAVSVVLGGCSSGASQADLAKASQSAAQAQAQKDAAAQQQKTQASLKAEVDKLKAAASNSATASKAAALKSSAVKSSTSKATAAQRSAAARVTSCGSNLSVGANTTCAFASNVESDYYSSGGGYQNLNVYSPVTGRYYNMICTPGVPTVCRGGNNAVVYIR